MMMRLLVSVMLMGTIQLYGAAQGLPALSQAVVERIYAYQERAERASSHSALQTVKGSFKDFGQSGELARAAGFNPSVGKLYQDVGWGIDSKLNRLKQAQCPNVNS